MIKQFPNYKLRGKLKRIINVANNYGISTAECLEMVRKYIQYD